jgi:hypothetical protein
MKRFKVKASRQIHGSGGKRPVPDSGDGNAGNHQRSTGTSLWFSLLKFEGEFID